MRKLKLIIVIFNFIIVSNAFATCIGLNCSCTISANNLSFGTYDPTSSSNIDNTTDVTVTCSALLLGGLIAYDISLSEGNSGSYSGREMSNSTHTLGYNLYTDSNRTTVWGDGTSSTSMVSDSYTLSIINTSRNYTIYGRISGSQNVSAGSYTDTITATVTF